MIKVDKMSVETEGTVVDIITELAMAMRAIGYKDKYLSKEVMHKLVDMAYKSDEEIHEEAMQVLKERSKQLNDLVDIFEKLEELRTKACENCPKKDTCEKRESCEENDTNDSSNKEEEVLKKIFRDILRDDK